MLFFSFLMLSSSLEKALNSKKTVESIINYGINNKVAKISYVPLVLLEVYLSCSIYWLGFNFIHLCLFILFITSVSILIIHNLYKGHKNISCGCGGVLENDELSYKLIIRNFSFIALIFYLYYQEVSLEVTISQTIILAILNLCLLLLLMAGKNLYKINIYRIKILKIYNEGVL
ncbi:MauE/DoxX family redox-associated membrane protein [Cytobacillus firmus]|uniref:MauE/DoxX family redox-associated membrane protein n=1 Tax=Cytobacillus firmus TaxID=1399 RepID=UPI0018CF7DDB|nr:MauE/DoxX family redox-associated membrane protein [Cytobacillus firmus]